jgi:hypothetical protein
MQQSQTLDAGLFNERTIYLTTIMLIIRSINTKNPIDYYQIERSALDVRPDVYTCMGGRLLGYETREATSKGDDLERLFSFGHSPCVPMSLLVD